MPSNRQADREASVAAPLPAQTAAALETCPAAAALLDHQFLFLAANQPFQDLTGLAAGSPGRAPAAVLFDQASQQAWQSARQAASLARPVSFYARLAGPASKTLVFSLAPEPGGLGSLLFAQPPPMRPVGPILRDLGLDLAGISDLAQALPLCLKAALMLTGAPKGGIYLANLTQGSFHLGASQGISESFKQSLGLLVANSQYARALRAGAPRYLNLAEMDPWPEMRKACHDEGILFAAVVPVSHHGRVVASINLGFLDAVGPGAGVLAALEAVASHLGSAMARLLAEREQTESETHLLSILHNADGFVVYRCLLDPEAPLGARLLMSSSSLVDVLDPQQPVLLETWFDIIHPEEKQRVLAAHGRFLDGQEPFRQEFRIWHRASARWRWVRVIHTLHPSDGHPTHLNGVIVDITEQKQAEQTILGYQNWLRDQVEERTAALVKANRELKAEIAQRTHTELRLADSERRHRLLMNNAPAAIFEMDLDNGGILTVNDVMVRWTGYRPEELLTMDVASLLEQNSRAEFLTDLDAARRGERGWTGGEYLMTSKSGRQAWLRLAVNLPLGEPGQARRVQVVASDNTKLKQARLAKEESQKRLEQLAENLPIIMSLTELGSGKRIYVSPSYDRIFGRSREDLLAGGHEVLDSVHPQDRERLAATYAAQAQGQRASAEVRMIRPDGEVRWVHFRCFPVLDEKGRPYRMANVVEDISERKRIEEALATLTGGVSHNFNNALMAIMSNTQAAEALLGRTPPDLAEARFHLAGVISAAKQGKEVLGRLAGYIASHRRGEADKRPVNLSELAGQARRMVGNLATALSEGRIVLTTRIAPNLWVRGIEPELREVIQNLLVNALEALEESGEIELSLVERDGLAILTVCDDGKGIPDGGAATLFQPFYSTKGRAAGLGLSISRAVADHHGGELTASRREHGGACFTLKLPLGSPQPPPHPQAAVVESLDKARVLLVEDEALVALGLESLLKARGCRVDLARDVAGARLFLGAGSYHFLLLDLGLPDGVGWEVMEEAARLAEMRGEPPPATLILTGWNSGLTPPRTEDSYRPLGILTKPVDRDALFEAMGKALGKPLA